MTDKQIIIDNLDVSGCEFYNKDDKTCREVNGKYDTDICEFDKCEGSNCNYKKWQRKEQECEELQRECAWIKESCTLNEGINYDIWYSQKLELDQLKAENDELKKYIKHLHNLCGSETDKQYKLKQTLTEIKEVATHCIKQDICTTCDNSDKCHIEDEGMPTYDICKLILQKISEVIDE